MAECFVLNNDFLIHKVEGSQFYGILAIRTGNPFRRGTILVSSLDNLRAATKEDFDAFRICSKGFFPE